VLHRLPDPAASAILDTRAPDLEPALRARLLAAAAGNPLALVELPTAAADAKVGLIAGSPALPVTARLERAFAARLRDVPEETRSLLLIAAADDSEALGEILTAGEILLARPVAPSMLRPALEARLVWLVGTDLHFRHPLVRSAITTTLTLSGARRRMPPWPSYSRSSQTGGRGTGRQRRSGAMTRSRRNSKTWLGERIAAARFCRPRPHWDGRRR
jgi:hypothetical protein